MVVNGGCGISISMRVVSVNAGQDIWRRWFEKRWVRDVDEQVKENGRTGRLGEQQRPVQRPRVCKRKRKWEKRKQFQ